MGTYAMPWPSSTTRSSCATSATAGPSGGSGSPPALAEQLAPGGRLVAPVEDGEQRLVVARRTDAGLGLTELERVRFVPLVSSRD